VVDEPSIRENATHVYSELTAIRDKLHVSLLEKGGIYLSVVSIRKNLRGYRSERQGLLSENKQFWNWSSWHGQLTRD